MDVWRSRGEFDRIKQNFVINRAPIGSQSSLNAGGGEGHDELKILLKNCLIASRFNQELRFKGKNIGIKRRNLREKLGPFDPVRVN